jgi:hypothetical protein
MGTGRECFERQLKTVGVRTPSDSVAVVLSIVQIRLILSRARQCQALERDTLFGNSNQLATIRRPEVEGRLVYFRKGGKEKATKNRSSRGPCKSYHAHEDFCHTGPSQVCQCNTARKSYWWRRGHDLTLDL